MVGPILGAAVIKYFENIFSAFGDSVLHSAFGFLSDAIEDPIVAFFALFVGDAWNLTPGAVFMLIAIFLPGGIMEGLRRSVALFSRPPRMAGSRCPRPTHSRRSRRMSKRNVVRHVADVHKSFGGLHALSDVDLQVARLGIQLVQEDRRIIPGLTVENPQLAQIAEPRGWTRTSSTSISTSRRAAQAGRRHALGGRTADAGRRRAVVRDIKLLLLDEPYEGLAPVIVKEIERIVHDIKQRGITTIIVEQNAVAALELANRAIILDMGEIVYDGSAADVVDNSDLRNKYLAS